MSSPFVITEAQLLSAPLLEDYLSPPEKLGLALHWIKKREPVIGQAIARQLKVSMNGGVRKIALTEGSLRVNPEFLARLSCRGVQCVILHEMGRLLTPEAPTGSHHGLYETAVDLWLNQRLLTAYFRIFAYMPPVQEETILSPILALGPSVGHAPVVDFPADLHFTEYAELLAQRFPPEAFDGVELRERLPQIGWTEELEEIDPGLNLQRCLPV